MYPKLFLFALPIVLLLVSIVVILLWDRKDGEPRGGKKGATAPEGAFRAFYHVLWMLVLWSGLAFSLPLWFSYKEKISGLAMPDRLFLIGKIVSFPVILLVLLGYGARQGYFKWIDSLEWPDKENS